MIIPTKTRKTILEALFADGVLVANKNFNQLKHCSIASASNLQVIMAMRVCSFIVCTRCFSEGFATDP
jgi:hypothetical protein